MKENKNTIPYHKIGEEFEYNGMTIKATEEFGQNGCKNCILIDDKCSHFECDREFRQDKKNVIFVECKQEEMKECEEKKEQVNHPTHYNTGNIEVISAIEDWDLNFSLGNVIKYVARAGHKSDDKIEDLEKAQWYLSREIERIKKYNQL